MNNWDESPGPGTVPDDTAAGQHDSDTRHTRTWYADRDPGERGWDEPAPAEGFGVPVESWGPPDLGPPTAGRPPRWRQAADSGRPGRRPTRAPRRRPPTALPVLAAVVLTAAVLAIVVVPHGKHAAQAPAASTARPGHSASAAPAHPAPAPAAVTEAGAQQILATYLAHNNTANQLRSDSLLAAIEGGSSFAMDAGAYRWTRVTNKSNSLYSPLTLASPQFYIPQATGYPRWFAVRGTWVKTSGTTESSAYLVFARTSAASPWLEVLEPNIITGAPAIQIAAGTGGNAIAVSPAAAAGLTSDPGSLPRLTAAYLDTGTGPLAGFTAPGDLQDLTDQAFWRPKLPAGSAATDSHSPTGDPVFGLRTASGGALEFYDLAATLTLTLPADDTAGFQIPGYYSAADPVSSAQVPYADQFAVYVPPGRTGRLQVVADDGGVASPALTAAPG